MPRVLCYILHMVAYKILIIAISRSTFYIKYLVWELLDIASGIFFSSVKYNCWKIITFTKHTFFFSVVNYIDINTCIFYVMDTNAGISLTNFP